MELWSNSIADLGMRNADCGLQIEFLVCNLSFSIRDPKSEITLAPTLQLIPFCCPLLAAHCLLSTGL